MIAMNIRVIGLVFLILGAAICQGKGGKSEKNGGSTGGCDKAPRLNNKRYSLEHHMYEDDVANWERRGISANYFPFGNVWNPNQVSFNCTNPGIMTIALEKCSQDCWGFPITSGEYRSTKFYGPGNKFEARFKAARGSGVINGFFTFAWDPHHEIDIEILGNDTTKIQVNVYKDGNSIYTSWRRM